MLDIGWTEVLVIGVVALFIIGPRDIPKALRTVGVWAGKVRALAREFRETVDDAVRETELDEVRRQVESVRTGFRDQVRSTIDPGGELTKSLEEVRNPLAETSPKPETPAPAPETPEDAPDGTPADPGASSPAAPAAPKAKEGPIGLRHLAGGGDGTPGSA